MPVSPVFQFTPFEFPCGSYAVLMRFWRRSGPCLFHPAIDPDFRAQGFVNRASVGDVDNLLAGGVIHIAKHLDLHINVINLAAFGLTIFAIPGVNLVVFQRDRAAGQGKPLMISLHFHGHGFAGTD